ncbi:MAG: helix-turn-helix domain-containing protein [Candidatus Acidiferrum sp.]|jgi:excisionase family DNA binding protein
MPKRKNQVIVFPESQSQFSVKDAPEYLKSLGVSTATTYTVRRLINQGAFPKIKVGRAFFVSKQAIDEWLQRSARKARA